ncbi:hypothetical protein SO802_033466 [Lithocarpus litseifolius]|uniref:Leucine-rich repeat-containing N-terminal plant-type domain-containing protein n=1 Tax=Lithocarpus litseifolius TaxID=425828 RepID=A0AAW2BD05_9ROSI
MGTQQEIVKCKKYSLDQGGVCGDKTREATALLSLKANWMNFPSNWVGSDPCGGLWVGIECINSRVTSIMLSNMNLTGQLSGDIGSFSKLQNLSLNSNKFIGQIPNSIGNLSNLYYLDLTDNQLEGPIPVSDGNGTKSGLDMLLQTRHLRFDRNSLNGLPSNLNSLTNVIELSLSNNNLSGPMANLTGMNSLSYLDMSNNSFTVSDVPPWIASLPLLTTLYDPPS